MIGGEYLGQIYPAGRPALAVVIVLGFAADTLGTLTIDVPAGIVGIVSSATSDTSATALIAIGGFHSNYRSGRVNFNTPR